MRERIVQDKKAASSVSIPTLKQPTRGFGLDSLNASPSAATQAQPINKPITHDISRISLRPQAKLTIGQPGDSYEQEADSVAQQVMQRMAQPGNRQSIQREEMPEEEEELQMKSLDISTLQRQEMPEEEEELQMKPLEISTLQRQEMPEEEEELQMKPQDISTLQRQEAPEEDIQAKSTLQSGEAIARMRDFHGATNGSQTKQAAQLHDIAANHPAQQLQPSQKKASSEPGGRENNTGLPDNLKSGIENLSGYSMDDVKVHYNSAQPTKLQAHAYAQGTDIHVAPGQEKHLPHEAWHVVQQKQGRVKPTMQMKGKVNVNDDVDLEREADEMGSDSLQRKAFPLGFNGNGGQKTNLASGSTVQLKPKNINTTHTLNVDNAGNITNAEAGRNDPPVSYPLNMAITKGVINSKEGDAVGGHLFKREYGGADDYSNVVTWSQKSEGEFTTFENQYLEQARTDAIGKGGVLRKVTTEATFTDFNVNLGEISLPDKQAPDGSMIKNRTIETEKDKKEGKEANYLLTNLIRGAMESIPNSVKASSKGVADWGKSGNNEFMKINENIDKEQVATRFDYLMDNIGEDKAQITRAVEKVKTMK
jgi:hypothetical protein